MPGRVGHITRIVAEPGVDAAIDACKDLDELKDVLKRIFERGFAGRVRAHNERTGEDWGGQFVVMSGGMIVFDVVNEMGQGLENLYDPDSEEHDDFTEIDSAATGFMPRRRKPDESQAVTTTGNRKK